MEKDTEGYPASWLNYKKKIMNLKEKLIQEGKTRWLDIGSAENFEPGFYYMDILPLKNYKTENIKDVASLFSDKYFEMDIRSLSDKEVNDLGKFDYIRMQHVLEHFTYEEVQDVLKNCAKLLKKDGIITISVPDLRVHIQNYLNNRYKNWNCFQSWAHKRIPKGSPNSFYFSIFSHSMPWEKHKWCYDYEGLEFQLKKSGVFKKIREFKATDELANVPFTHNRPEEDVCVIASRKRIVPTNFL